MLKKNPQGICSKTFNKLHSPKFAPKARVDESGLRITTIIDKKTKKPINAYVAKIEEKDPNKESYYLMVPDSKEKFDFKNRKYKIVGETYFFINKKII